MMTPLRRQLEQARDDYRRAAYPGDLAADLRRRIRPDRGWWVSAVGLAVAACLAVAVVRLDPVRDKVADLAGYAIVPALPEIPVPSVGDRPEPLLVRLVSVPGPAVRQVLADSQQTVNEIGMSVESVRRRVGDWITHYWS